MTTKKKKKPTPQKPAKQPHITRRRGGTMSHEDETPTPPAGSPGEPVEPEAEEPTPAGAPAANLTPNQTLAAIGATSPRTYPPREGLTPNQLITLAQHGAIKAEPAPVQAWQEEKHGEESDETEKSDQTEKSDETEKAKYSKRK
jgi:hypothetical protein